jgi:hypothetical protein
MVSSMKPASTFYVFRQVAWEACLPDMQVSFFKEYF